MIAGNNAQGIMPNAQGFLRRFVLFVEHWALSIGID
jgi:hypothetical protein